MSDTRISVRIGAEALERLDGLAAERGLSRSGALRALLERGGAARAAADRQEALTLLSESARGGSVAARVALARLLERRLHTAEPEPPRAADPFDEFDELARTRNGDGNGGIIDRLAARRKEQR